MAALNDTAVRLTDEGLAVEVYLGNVDETSRTARHDVFVLDPHLAIALADDLAKAASQALDEVAAHEDVLRQGDE